MNDQTEAAQPAEQRPVLGAQELISSAEAIESLARLFRHMERASATLRSVASIANAEQEYSARAQQALRLVGETEEQLAEAKRAVVAAEVERERLIASARTEVAEMRASAEAEANTIIATAQERVKAIANDGHAAQVAREDAGMKRLSEIGEQVSAKLQALDELQAATDVKAEELRQLEEKLAQARQAAASIIGVAP